MANWLHNMATKFAYQLCQMPYICFPCGKFLADHYDNLVCYYLSRMARGDHQNDDDDFMDPPQRNRATGWRKEGDEVTVHTPLVLLMFLDATSSFAVVCHELKFHDSAKHGNN